MKKLMIIMVFTILPTIMFSQQVNFSIEPAKKADDKAFKLYPNPSNGIFVAHFPANFNSRTSLMVYDNSGKRIYVNERLTVNTVRIDLSHMQPGIYFANFVIGNEIHTERIVILTH